MQTCVTIAKRHAAADSSQSNTAAVLESQRDRVSGNFLNDLKKHDQIFNSNIFEKLFVAVKGKLFRCWKRKLFVDFAEFVMSRFRKAMQRASHFCTCHVFPENDAEQVHIET